MNQENDSRPVVGFGLVNKDFVASVPAWERDQKTSATAYFEQAGGPVPVALTAIARLGMAQPVSFVGLLGDDNDGGDIARWLAEDGVDTSHLTRATGMMSSKSLVLLDERDGSRTLANYAAHLPPMTFTPEQEALLTRARLLHLDGRDLPAAERAAEIVKASGGTVSLDLGTWRPGRERLLSLCDIVLASRKGARGAFPEAATPEEQARRFLDLGASVAGVTLAQEGVVIGARDSETMRLPAFAVSGIVDTCGAGDTFHGALLWAYLQGWGPAAAADFAQAAVAVRITRLGNRAGLPTRAEVEAFLASAPRRSGGVDTVPHARL